MDETSKENRLAFGGNKARNAFIDSMPLIMTNKATNDLYKSLKMERRLDRFKALLKVCSSKGLTVRETVETLKSSLPGYITNKTLTIPIFVEMIREYSDIAECWGYGNIGDEINRQMVMDKALELALSTSLIEDIKQYNEMYDTEYSGVQEDNKSKGDKGGTGSTGVNFQFSLVNNN